jgi:hypothetical protein
MIERARTVQQLSEYLMDNGYFRNCLNCKEWNEVSELCTKYLQRPPAKVIVTGCSEHSDLIPF